MIKLGVLSNSPEFLWGLNDVIEKYEKAVSDYKAKNLTDLERTMWSLAKKKKIYKLDVINKHSKTIPSYFVGLTPNFRHEGVDGKMPEKVFLMKLNSVEEGQVAVFLQESGAGKTVELAGSAFTRNADLTVFPAISIDLEGDLKNLESDKRNQTACDAFKGIMSRFVEDYKSKCLSKIVNAAKEKLNVVVAFDEALAHALFVCSLIASKIDMAQIVEDQLKSLSEDKNLSVSVQFSVAGTGSSRGTIGSIQKNFVRCKTSASQQIDEVFNVLGKGMDFTFAELGKCIPVLHKMLNNARIMSIALSQIRKLAKMTYVTEKDIITQHVRYGTRLVRETVQKYIKSNALRDIAKDHLLAALVGARALAVHIFQEPVTLEANQSEQEKQLSEFTYGLKFNKEKRNADEISMMRIVGRYGLLVPNAPNERGAIETPFTLSPSMQLVSLFLLGLSEEVNFLETSSFGFEALSTQLLKAAIASSLTICVKSRPSAQDALKAVGVHPIKNADQTKGLRKLWKALRNYVVVGGAGKGRVIETVMHQYPMEILKKEDGERKVELVRIDKSVYDNVASFLPIKGFFVPCASIARGNSDLADGYVTFFLKKKKERISEAIIENSVARDDTLVKATIKIQCKDYLAEQSNVRPKELLKNVDLCFDPSLGPIFGEEKLMCVAGKSAKLDKKIKSNTEYNFLAFCLDKSEILKDLMSDLEDLRSESRGLHSYLLKYDNGELMEYDGSDEGSKRKGKESKKRKKKMTKKSKKRRRSDEEGRVRKTIKKSKIVQEE